MPTETQQFTGIITIIYAQFSKDKHIMNNTNANKGKHNSQVHTNYQIRY